MNDTESIIFFDTFFHGNNQMWLDMVKFNIPVKITEIRVVPNGDIVRCNLLAREGSTKVYSLTIINKWYKYLL